MRYVMGVILLVAGLVLVTGKLAQPDGQRST